MKKQSFSILVLFVLFTMLVSACAPAGAPAASASSVGGGRARGDIVIEGPIEAINGSQWTVNGQTFTVPQELTQGGSFQVGDTVVLEAKVLNNGAAQLTSVKQSASAAGGVAAATAVPVVPPVDVLPATPAPVATSAPVSGSPVTTQPSAGAQTFNGVVEAINGDQWTISGQTFTVPAALLLDPTLTVGSFVQLNAQVAADGTITVGGIQVATASAATGWSNGAAGDDDGMDDDSQDNDNEDDSQSDDSQDDSQDDNSDSQDGNSQDSDDDNH
ncbi:MAG: hypothetical protein Fur002_02840 [Anaerolineales bacterium]